MSTDRVVAPEFETSTPAVSVEDVHVTYKRGDVEVQALRGISLALTRGSYTAIMGPSGSGKSTLLRVVAGLWPPTSGVIRLDGVDLGRCSDSELAIIRRRNVGFVHQLFNLLPDLSTFDNVALPLLLDGLPDAEIRDRVASALESLGIGSKASQRPDELSGGEMLRVALARALVIEPSIILADEPTGSLDQENGRNVLGLFSEIHERLGTTVVMVTHDPEVAATAKQTLHMMDGRLVTG